MKKTDNKLYYLYMIFGIALVTANCIASKVFDTGLTLFGAPMTLTVGAICYPITFLITDIIGELWGKEKATIAVKGGFVCQVISTAIIIIASYLPAVDSGVQQSYQTLLGQNWVFVTASLVAYLCSQTCDVKIFHAIRDAYVRKHGSTKGGKWIWNNASTMTSQLIDSVIYATIAFGLGFGWLWNGNIVMLLNMILGQWIIKAILALLDTPFFYLLTRQKATDGN